MANSASLMDDIKHLKDQIHEELFKEVPDTNKVNVLIQKLGYKYEDVMHLNFHHFMELKGIFPTDSLEEYKIFIHDIMDRMDQFRPHMQEERMRRNRHRHG